MEQRDVAGISTSKRVRDHGQELARLALAHHLPVAVDAPSDDEAAKITVVHRTGQDVPYILFGVGGVARRLEKRRILYRPSHLIKDACLQRRPRCVGGAVGLIIR